MWVHEMVHKTKTIKAICGEAAISRATLYNWLSEYQKAESEQKQAAGNGESAGAPPRWEPNDKYKMLLSALVKTDSDKTISRQLAKELVKRYNLTIAQACSLVDMPEEHYGYRPRKPEADDKDVYAALVNLLAEDSSRSLEDCVSLLQNAQPNWAIKQVKRIYRQGRLYLKRTRMRRIARLPEETALSETATTGVFKRITREAAFWHIGLVEQNTAEGNAWLLFVLDFHDGIPLNALTGNGQVTETDILQLVTKAAAENGTPKKIRIPAQAPFMSRDLTRWSWDNRVAIYQLSMAKPENLLEAEFIQDDIKKQLAVNEHTSVASLSATTEQWLSGFAGNRAANSHYFEKEPVA